MSLLYRYNLVRLGRLIPSLGGRTVRPRPLIPVSLVGPLNTVARTALLDTGADDTIFPLSLAATLGVDLTGAPTGSATVAGIGIVPLVYGDVKLRLTDGREQREWNAMVGFTKARLIYPTLGFAGCLQYF